MMKKLPHITTYELKEKNITNGFLLRTLVENYLENPSVYQVREGLKEETALEGHRYHYGVTLNSNFSLLVLDIDLPKEKQDINDFRYTADKEDLYFHLLTDEITKENVDLQLTVGLNIRIGEHVLLKFSNQIVEVEYKGLHSFRGEERYAFTVITIFENHHHPFKAEEFFEYIIPDNVENMKEENKTLETAVKEYDAQKEDVSGFYDKMEEALDINHLDLGCEEDNNNRDNNNNKDV